MTRTASDSLAALSNKVAKGISQPFRRARAILPSLYRMPGTPGCSRNPPGRQREACEERTDVFPDDLSFFGNFEQAAEGRLRDQRIAVRQALRVAHTRREKVPAGLSWYFHTISFVAGLTSMTLE